MKTMMLAMIALACLATTIPTASACYSTNPVIQYAYCGGGAASDAEAAVEFAHGEAHDVITFVQSTEAWDLLP